MRASLLARPVLRCPGRRHASGDDRFFKIVLSDPMRKRMLPDLKGKKVEIVLGVFDAVEGEVVHADERWLTLRNKRRFVYVQIDKIRHLACNDH